MTIIHIGRSVEFHNPPGFSLLGLQQATRNLKFMLIYINLNNGKTSVTFQKCMVELHGKEDSK